jgi:hypothetical protein
MDKLPEGNAKPEYINAYVSKDRTGKNRGTNNVLLASGILVLVAIVLMYLTDIAASVSFSWKDFTLNGILVFVGSQCLHSIAKAYSRNRKRDEKEYEEAAKKSKEAIEELVKSEYSARVNEYCNHHTEETTVRIKTAILSPAGLTYKDYTEKYIGKNGKELLNAYPEEKLTKEQLKAIKKCNRVKIKPYDPNFLRESFSDGVSELEPSNRYKPKRDYSIETLRNAVQGLFLCLFAVNIGGDIILNWSFATFITCLIKVFCAVMQAVNGFIFGTNNVQTEINLLLTKSSEAKACLEWCKANPKECI